MKKNEAAIDQYHRKNQTSYVQLNIMSNPIQGWQHGKAALLIPRRTGFSRGKG